MNRTLYNSIILALILSSNIFGQISIQSIVFDSTKGYFAIEYVKEGSDSIKQGTIKTNNNISPLIQSSVLKIDSLTFKYIYSVTNTAASIDPLYEIGIRSRLPISNIQKPNNEWDGFYSTRNGEVNWAKIGGAIPGIVRDYTVNGFSFHASQIPSITDSYSRNYVWYSFPDEIEGPFGKLEALIDSVYTLSIGVKQITLGPWLPDSTLSLKSFTDTLETYRYRSCEELGWATDTTVCGQLEQQLTDVKTALQDQDSLGAANVLSEFIQLVEEEKETNLTSEGYALLFFNAQYLAERLPEPQVSSGITCECANLVTQTSGQIRFSGWETRCISGDFSGSVFFQQSGRLEVCGNATFQTISGNNPGTVAISETGVVSIQNWNNNNPTDSLVNWGTTQFQNQVNVNRGHLFNAGTLVVNGGLNQNNGSIENTGSFSVGRSVTLNQAGVRNAGNWSVGQRLTLNANAEMVNECQLMVEGTLMLNSTLTTRQKSLVSVGGRMTINSQGLLSVQGTNTMVSVGSTRLNGAITSNGANQLLVSSGNVQFNNGAAINSMEDTLRVVAPNFADLSTTFTVADGTNTIIPISTCNSNGFNN